MAAVDTDGFTLGNSGKRLEVAPRLFHFRWIQSLEVVRADGLRSPIEQDSSQMNPITLGKLAKASSTSCRFIARVLFPSSLKRTRSFTIPSASEGSTEETGSSARMAAGS